MKGQQQNKYMSLLKSVATVYHYATTETYPDFATFAASLKEELDRYDDEGVLWEDDRTQVNAPEEEKESLEYM